MSHRHEINAILKQVEAWPAEARHTLATELLRAASSAPVPPPRDTLSLAKAVAASATRPPPTDEEVDQWIHDHRMSKYGGGAR